MKQITGITRTQRLCHLHGHHKYLSIRGLAHFHWKWKKENIEQKRKELTLGFGEDGEAKSPDVKEAEPDRGEAERTHQQQPPSKSPHSLWDNFTNRWWGSGVAVWKKRDESWVWWGRCECHEFVLKWGIEDGFVLDFYVQGWVEQGSAIGPAEAVNVAVEGFWGELCAVSNGQQATRTRALSPRAHAQGD